MQNFLIYTEQFPKTVMSKQSLPDMFLFSDEQSKSYDQDYLGQTE